MKSCVLRAGIVMDMASRVDQRVLRWLGHVERMDEYRMTRRVLIVGISVERVWDRPKLGWINGLRVALSSRGMTVEAARQLVMSEELWCIWRC